MATNERSANLGFDVIIVGGGSAGYAAARTATAAGLKTAVVEGGKEVGGLCILRGCMPTKALLYAAEVRHLIQHSPTWGLQPDPARFDWSGVMQRKSAQNKDFADYRRQQLEDGRFTFIRAQAQFIDPNTLALSDGRCLNAPHFIISTGSVTSPPPLPQLGATGYITSDDAVGLIEPPKSLIVLGGGAVAAEFAQFFARFDVEVTLIQRSDQLLRDFDADAALTVETVFQREGIRIHKGTQLLDARREGAEKVVVFRQNDRVVEARAQEILCALGRTANTAGLNLAKAGVSLDGARIISDKHQRTTAPHIFAAGDCTGPHEIVHIAIQQGEIAAHNIAHPQRLHHFDDRLLLSVVFTDPQVAQVGLTEKAAKARGLDYRVASYPFNDHGKSLIMEARDGFVKLLAEPKHGQLLGGACVGPVGGELIHEIVAAMAGRLNVRQLAMMPHYHPTLAEIWTYPAEELADHICGMEMETEPCPGPV